MPLHRSRGEIVAPRPCQEMTLEELTNEWARLMEKRIALDDGVRQLQLQIDAVKDRFARFRESADDRWYHDTVCDLKSRRSRIATIDLQLKVIDRLRQDKLRVAKQEHNLRHLQAHTARDRTHDRTFVHVAKRLLPEATFTEIWRQVHAELGLGGDAPDDPA